jgi:hypothetical protein
VTPDAGVKRRRSEITEIIPEKAANHISQKEAPDPETPVAIRIGYEMRREYR